MPFCACDYGMFNNLLRCLMTLLSSVDCSVDVWSDWLIVIPALFKKQTDDEMSAQARVQTRQCSQSNNSQ